MDQRTNHPTERHEKGSKGSYTSINIGTDNSLITAVETTETSAKSVVKWPIWAYKSDLLNSIIKSARSLSGRLCTPRSVSLWPIQHLKTNFGSPHFNDCDCQDCWGINWLLYRVLPKIIFPLIVEWNYISSGLLHCVESGLQIAVDYSAFCLIIGRPSSFIKTKGWHQ